jgi:hypothetical protein
MTETLSALIAGHDGLRLRWARPGARGWITAHCAACRATVAAALHGAGVGRGDRVAIVLPNGPEMAAAFVTVAQVATTCPLNPAYKEDEFAFYLEDLKAKAIILMEGEEGPAHRGGRAAGTGRGPAGARCRWRRGRLFAARRRQRRDGGQRCAGPGGCGADPAYLGHDLAAQDRAAPAIEPRGLGAQYRGIARSDVGRTGA